MEFTFVNDCFKDKHNLPAGRQAKIAGIMDKDYLVSVHKVLSLNQNVHFQGLRFKINVEFTGVNDHLF